MSTDVERDQDFLPLPDELLPIRELSSELLSLSPMWLRVEEGDIIQVSHIVRLEVASGCGKAVRYGLMAYLIDGSEVIVVSGDRDYVLWYLDQLSDVLSVFKVKGDYVSAEEFLEEA